jgi:septal ring factor EnvC (AmiA/AmiB activator)
MADPDFEFDFEAPSTPRRGTEVTPNLSVSQPPSGKKVTSSSSSAGNQPAISSPHSSSPSKKQINPETPVQSQVDQLHSDSSVQKDNSANEAVVAEMQAKLKLEKRCKDLEADKSSVGAALRALAAAHSLVSGQFADFRKNHDAMKAQHEKDKDMLTGQLAEARFYVCVPDY